MPEDRDDRCPSDVARQAPKAQEVEARRLTLERAERLAISELAAQARSSRRRPSRRELLAEHLGGLS